MRDRAWELIGWSTAVWAERLLLAGLVASSALMGLGTAWDVHWHWTVGRDWFWTPPHMLLYSGSALTGFLAFLVVFRTSVERGSPGVLMMFRSLLSRGWGSVAIGSALMIAAAVFDDIWHRTIGDRAIWSPPHVMGVTGGLIITLGTTIAFLHAGRRQVLPPSWVRVGVIQLLAGLIVTAYFGLTPATLMVFLQDATGLRFYISTPYIVAALASLMVPAMVTCYPQVLGRRGFEIATVVAVGLWVLQTVSHLVATPLVAGLTGYAMNPSAVPDLRFEFLTLSFLLIPPLVVSPLGIRQPWVAGAMIGVLYAAGLTVWLGALGMERGGVALPIAGVVILGAISAASGNLCGQWIRRVSSA